MPKYLFVDPPHDNPNYRHNSEQDTRSHATVDSQMNDRCDTNENVVASSSTISTKELPPAPIRSGRTELLPSSFNEELSEHVKQTGQTFRNNLDVLAFVASYILEKEKSLEKVEAEAARSRGKTLETAPSTARPKSPVPQPSGQPPKKSRRSKSTAARRLGPQSNPYPTPPPDPSTQNPAPAGSQTKEPSPVPPLPNITNRAEPIIDERQKSTAQRKEKSLEIKRWVNITPGNPQFGVQGYRFINCTGDPTASDRK
ncbi:hypothetical protein AX16_003983 [Volvariella volvacea WC 439]|nr:hypothetical protein AX16_003983 [Volvariella volvacea WC 439]